MQDKMQAALSLRACPACRGEIELAAQFCGHCGIRVVMEDSPTDPVDVVPLVRHARQQRQDRDKPRLLFIEEQPEEPAGNAKSEAAFATRAPRDSGPRAPLQRQKASAERPAAATSAEQPTNVRAAAGSVERDAEVDPNRRRAKRFPLKVEVDFASAHNFYTGFVENVSSGGLFIATYLPAQIGESLVVTFTLPGLDQSCTATCEVRWLREQNPTAPDTIPGMGLKFTELDAEAEACIDRFIRRRDPIFFDDEP